MSILLLSTTIQQFNVSSRYVYLYIRKVTVLCISLSNINGDVQLQEGI